jgi:hypothetical protein
VADGAVFSVERRAASERAPVRALPVLRGGTATGFERPGIETVLGGEICDVLRRFMTYLWAPTAVLNPAVDRLLASGRAAGVGG